MASNPTPPGQPKTSARPVVNVLVATTAMLSFISFWRAGAIVLNDLASSAYYAGGEAELFIGKSAPWFILGVMLLAYAVSLIYVESCSMFVRGGVYRVVKEAMGGTLAKLSVSALMFDFILTGPISGVAAGHYIASLGNELLRYGHIDLVLSVNGTAATIAILVTVYFWWQNIKGIPESSEKALRIMQTTTVMVVILIGWCIYTVYVRGAHWPPAPLPQNMILDKHSLGWLSGFHFARTFTLLIIFVGLGHSVLAMSGEETLAQVYREIEHPKLANLKKTALIIVAYSLAFTALVSIFAVMIIPDNVRPHFFENLIGGLSMNLQGPFGLRLAFHVFVVVVGMLILSGAVNTAIVGSNGVLSRISEDGVLTDWFRHPHKRYGTTHRIITSVAGLQILTILASRGDVNYLGNLYAFGVTWSFAMKGIGVLVLRYTHPQDREYRVPLNFTIAGKEVPLGLGLITLTLLLIAIVNLFTKPDATIAGVVFSVVLFLAFVLSEKHVQKQHGTKHSTELDQFNLAQEADLTPASVGVRPGNILVPVSNYYALYHLHSVLERLRTDQQDIVVLHIRLLRRAASGEYDLNPEQLFSTIEQLLFTKVLAIAEKEGKPIRLAVAAANDLWDGILRSAANLQSASIVVGGSSKMGITEQAREVGIAWERMPEPRPRVALEIITAGGQQRVFYLGPHSPHLTPKEIDLLHNVWLELSDELKGEEIHHHDIIHFALTELEREIAEGQGEAVLARLRQHLQEIKDRRPASP
ncbi:MAG TPA: APC family permease [Candidatus Acidoferrales bacterium]|nr:APC family permease [Candidatus Acidoferrales bacterium]